MKSATTQKATVVILCFVTNMANLAMQQKDKDGATASVHDPSPMLPQMLASPQPARLSRDGNCKVVFSNPWGKDFVDIPVTE